MTTSNTSAESRDGGWCAVIQGTVRAGNNVWFNHSSTFEGTNPDSDSRLIGYLSGSPNAGSDRTWGFRGKIESLNIGELFNPRGSQPSILNPSPFVPGQVLDKQGMGAIMSRLKAAGVQQGDYLFVDGSGTDPHGFIIVGEGPALPCNASDLDNLLFWGSIPLSGTSLGSPLLPRVFYVADDGRQRHTPRPFYCSRFNNPAKFDHERWDFYKIPSTISVPCDRVYRDADGSIPKPTQPRF